MPVLAASLLGADPLELGAAITAAEVEGIDRLHVDAMDGAFVPNIAFGRDAVAALDRRTGAFLDVHLMLSRPDHFLEDYAAAGADAITIHLEAGLHHHRHLARIRELGARCGLALNPGTPLDAAAELLGVIDVLLIMSVDPGYGGQAFIPSTVRKVEQASGLRTRHGYGFEVVVDGGVNADTIGEVVRAGPDVLVCGTALFRGDVHANAARLWRAMGG